MLAEIVMGDAEPFATATILELRAWEIRGTEKVLVAERFRDHAGCRRTIWHVPEASIKGILWVEHLEENDAPISADGID